MLINLPDPALVLLIGPSGAGKSTFAASHFRPTQIVSSDSVRAMLTDDEADQGSSAQAFHIVALILNGRLARRLTTVIDATNLRAVNRKRYARLAARYGVPTVAIAFDMPLDEYMAWNASRPDRTVDDFVVEDQAARMTSVVDDLGSEGYSAVHVLRSRDEVAGTRVTRLRDE